MANKTIHVCNKEVEITAIKTTLDMFMPEIREILSMNNTALKAEIRSNHDMEMLKLEEVISHQKVTNGRVTALENTDEKIYENIELIKTKGREVIEYQKVARWIINNPGKSIMIIIAFLFMLAVVATAIDIKTMLNLL